MWLTKLTRDPQEIMFDFAIQIRRLASLAHAYIPVEDSDWITLGFPIPSVHSRAIQRHLLSVDAATVGAAGNSDWPKYKAVGEDTAPNQLRKLQAALANHTEVLSLQSAMLTAQTEAVSIFMPRLEALEHDSRKPNVVRLYGEVVGQSRSLTRALLVTQPSVCLT